ncbi:MAG: portal protein, partial [Rhodobacterales bacterium 34-62-10]
EFSFQRLWALRKVVLGAGATQTLLSAAVLAAAGWALGLDLAIAMVLGLAFALSSTAIVMQMMVEQKRAAQPVGQTSLGVLLFQDVMVAPILIFVGFVGIKSGANLGGVLLDALVRGLIAIAVIWALGQFVLGRVFLFATTIGGRDVLMALTLLTVVGAAAITYGAGLSVALGAFLAGLLVGETEFKHQTEVDLEPFKGLLLGIFFMTVGMGLDLPAIQEQLGPILAVMAGLIVVKVAIAYLACRVFAGGHRVGIETALLLAPAGEFAFIILTAAQSGNAISAETATFASAVAGLSMLLTPLLGQLGRRLAARAPEPVDAEGMELTDPSEMENHVVLAGYGRVGHA